MEKPAGRTVLSAVAALVVGSTLLTLMPGRVSGVGPCPLNCSGNGVCDFNTSVCSCNPCSSGSGCEVVCSGNGTCLNSSPTSGACSCSPGYSGPQCGTAAPCSLGFYSATGTIPCSPCPSGTFANASGSTFCYPCSPGRYQPSSGSTGCLNCGPGTYQPASGGTTCFNCSPGTYQPSFASSTCFNCSPGTVQPAPSGTACINCALGTSQPAPGSTSCVACTPGTFANTSGSALCTDCSTGTYQPSTASTSCLNCAPGTYADTTGSISCDTCTVCPAGQYQSAICTTTSDTGCAPCDPSCLTCSGGSATDCTSCDVGYELSGGACVATAGTCSPTALLGCVQPTKAVVLVKETVAGNEKLKVVLKQLVPAVTQGQFGDPVTGTSQYNLCLYDDAGALVADLNVDKAGASCGTPPKPCWKPISTLGYKYVDGETTADGVAKIVGKGGDPLQGKVVFKAANNVTLGQANLPTGIAAALLNNTQATAQIVVDDGSCFGQTVTSIKRNDGLVFKATEP